MYSFSLGPWRRFGALTLGILFSVLLLSVLYLLSTLSVQSPKEPRPKEPRPSPSPIPHLPQPPPYHPPVYHIPSIRPLEDQRTFTSQAVEDFIINTTKRMKDKDLITLFTNCFPNALDTAVDWYRLGENPGTFLITGDIPAMWIRDSTHQILPFIPISKQDPRLQNLVLGVLNVQSIHLHYDPYANAFLRPWDAPEKDMRRGADDSVTPDYDSSYVWESKYGLDSLANFLQLSTTYMETTGDYKGVLGSLEWLKAIPRVFTVIRDQTKGTWDDPWNNISENVQRGIQNNITSQDDPYSSTTRVRKPPLPVPLHHGYRFQRMTQRPKDTLENDGAGTVVRACGLVKSAFRPSDDATTFSYHIPANAQLSVQLERLSLQLRQGQEENSDIFPSFLADIAQEALHLSHTIREAIELHGVIHHAVLGRMYAYEVDCYGSFLLMDDATMPSLLGLPVLGYTKREDPVYIATRAFVLSNANPWYFEGSFAKGIGGSSTGRDMIWPMSLLIGLQTTTCEDEIKLLLDTVKRWAAHTGHMCEAFDKNTPTRFTRPWFSWTNGLAGTTLVYLLDHFPHL
ncbi:hypothetical protein BDF14DRAFT_1824638, partial [Spinellus fusiger]